MKKFFSMVALLVLSLVIAVPAFAANSESYIVADIDGHWAQPEIDNFINADLIKGKYVDSDGYTHFDPNGNMTRSEFVVALVQIAGLTTDLPGKIFEDVRENLWYTNQIRIASALGIANGVDATHFGVSQKITRAEMATMIVKAFEAKKSIAFSTGTTKFTDVPQFYATEYIGKAYNTGLISGTSATTFSPSQWATRAQVIVVLNHAVMKENSSLPTEDELFNVINSALKDQVDSINSGQIDFHLDKYFTGYGMAPQVDSMDYINEMINEGLQFKAEIVSAEQFKVSKISDRFAVVESTGGNIKITTSYQDETYEDTESLDGSYYLIKVGDTWKIYNEEY
ncbi:S-layer homology domain-containing protein [Gorillibacterium massiliense]|uniref:S-layer homology domain-containing protein n=1 Tax=Gorillibacterium massiliense TaxID=1280390 RepID=UPI0004AFD6A7|nr:S-layer homology domain-containing protein [Gorillibacterium massiliense]